jgi:iron complex transport system permease protein
LGAADRGIRTHGCCGAAGFPLTDTAEERAVGLVAQRRVTPPWAVGAIAAVAGALLAGVLIGPVDIGIGAIARSALARVPLLDVESPLTAAEEAIVWELRLPRVALGALVGAMLAVAGASYQGVFRNPLADPYLLGVAAGAGLGATVAISYGPIGADGSLLPLAAFAGAVLAVAGAYAIGRSLGGERTTATLILAGVTVAAFLTAVQTFVQQQNAETLNEVYSWLLGGLATAGWREVVLIAPYVVFSSAVLLLHRRTLDVLAVGDDEARSLGLDVTRTRLLLVGCATLGTAAAVSVSGLIGFVGIVVPHLVRLAVAPSFRVILPLSVALGAAFLVLADVLARTLLAPAELPIGVVTALVGAPFFALVLRTTRHVP